MEQQYYITKEQLGLIGHYKSMFEFSAENIKELCKGEKDDIVYGFELGKLHYNLRDWFVEMIDLENEIKNQKIEVKKTSAVMFTRD